MTLAVTLSDDLLDQLDRVAFEADVPLRWLVAGLAWIPKDGKPANKRA